MLNFAGHFIVHYWLNRGWWIKREEKLCIIVMKIMVQERDELRIHD